MGWIIGKGIGVPFRLGGSGLGSTYWLTRTPSDLVLTVVSDVRIDGTFTINGTGQDGHKVYISTDNTTFTLLATLIGTDNTFSATGLTATLYYVKVTAYKGSSESDATTTILANTALLCGWTFDDFSTKEITGIIKNAGDSAFLTINTPSAIYYNGFTYIVYSGYLDRPYIIKYNHSTNTFSESVEISETALAVSDDHGQPCLVIDTNGYIHVFWGAHTGVIRYSKSDNPEDITSWTGGSSPTKGTYPQLIKFSNDDIYMFFRQTTSPDCIWGYIKSSNNCATWGSFVSLSEDFAYCKFTKGNGDIVHVSMVGANQTSLDRKNLSYYYFDGTNIKNIAGDTLVAPIVLTGIADVLVYDTADKTTLGPDVVVDLSNNVFFALPLSVDDDSTDGYGLKFIKYNSGWQIYDCGVTYYGRQAYHNPIELSGSDIYIHHILYDEDISPVDIGGIQRIKSSDGGETWSIDEIIIDKGNFQRIVKVQDGQNPLKYITSDYSGDVNYFENTICGFGDDGFVGENQYTVYNKYFVNDINERFPIIKKSGASDIVNGHVGNCLFINNDNISRIVKYNPIFDFSSVSGDKPFSICFWIKPTADVTTYQYLISRGITADREWFISIRDGKIRLVLYDSLQNMIGQGAPIAGGDWVFICMTYDSTAQLNGIKIFINNVESQDTTFITGVYSQMNIDVYDIDLGQFSSGDSPFAGHIDEIKFFGRVLSPIEMGYVKDNVVGW